MVDLSSHPITAQRLAEQEECFAQAFRCGDIQQARSLYHPEVVYVSPTVRLFGFPARIEGIDKTLQFIALTIEHLEAIDYRAVESAIVPDGAAAFVRIHFDWTRGAQRLRSNYVVVYRYRGRHIGRQELYYDPSGRLEEIG